LVQRLEELAARAAEVFHQSCVDLVEQLTDGLVQVGEAEQGAVSQASEDPALDHLDTNLRLGLVFGLTNACRNDRRTIVLGQVLVGGIQVGFVATGVFDACFEIVWDNDLGYTAKESEHADVGADPTG